MKFVKDLMIEYDLSEEEATDLFIEMADKLCDEIRSEVNA